MSCQVNYIIISFKQIATKQGFIDYSASTKIPVGGRPRGSWSLAMGIHNTAERIGLSDSIFSTKVNGTRMYGMKSMYIQRKHRYLCGVLWVDTKQVCTLQCVGSTMTPIALHPCWPAIIPTVTPSLSHPSPTDALYGIKSIWPDNLSDLK